MKTAIYIEDGTVQLVITPESEFEKNALSSFEEKTLDAKIFAGSFYACQAGWVRIKSENPPMYSHQIDGRDKSLILTVIPEKEQM